MLSLVCVCVLLFIGTDAAPKPKPAPQYGDWYLGPQRAPMQYGDWYLNPTQRAPMQYGDWYLNPMRGTPVGGSKLQGWSGRKYDSNGCKPGYKIKNEAGGDCCD